MTKGSIFHAAGGVVVTLSRVQPNAASAFQKVLLQGHLTKQFPSWLLNHQLCTQSPEYGKESDLSL